MIKCGMHVLTNARLSPQLYSQETLHLARRLLGCELVTSQSGNYTSGIIVETEAYHGEIDPACHCYHTRTPRNEVMFSKAGTFYVYLIYGMHYCVNLVSEKEGIGAAVLIRALKPKVNIPLMYERRGVSSDRALASGPGKLCQALGITRDLSGEHCTTSASIWIEQHRPLKPENIIVTTRIGIRKGQELPWRFYVKDSPFISRT